MSHGFRLVSVQLEQTIQQVHGSACKRSTNPLDLGNPGGSCRYTTLNTERPRRSLDFVSCSHRWIYRSLRFAFSGRKRSRTILHNIRHQLIAVITSQLSSGRDLHNRAPGEHLLGQRTEDSHATCVSLPWPFWERCLSDFKRLDLTSLICVLEYCSVLCLRFASSQSIEREQRDGSTSGTYFGV